MMRRTLRVGLVGLLLALGAPPGASAQASIVAAAGATAPLAGYGDYAEIGWLARAGFTLPVSDARLEVGAEAIFGRNGHEAPPGGDKSYLWGAVGTVSRAFAGPYGLAPYAFGVTGLLVESFRSNSQPGLDASEAGFALGGGGGVGFPAGELSAFIDVSFLNGFRRGGDIVLFGVTAGVRLPIDGF